MSARLPPEFKREVARVLAEAKLDTRRLLRTPRAVAQYRFRQARAAWKAVTPETPPDARDELRQAYTRATLDLTAAWCDEMRANGVVLTPIRVEGKAP